MTHIILADHPTDKGTYFKAGGVAVCQNNDTARLRKPFYKPLLIPVLKNSKAVSLYYYGIKHTGKFYFIILALDYNRLFYLNHQVSSF